MPLLLHTGIEIDLGANTWYCCDLDMTVFMVGVSPPLKHARTDSVVCVQPAVQLAIPAGINEEASLVVQHIDPGGDMINLASNLCEPFTSVGHLPVPEDAFYYRSKAIEHTAMTMPP